MKQPSDLALLKISQMLIHITTVIVQRNTPRRSDTFVSAARPRKELNIDMLKHPFRATAGLIDETSFAMSMIAEEHASSGSQNTEMLEEQFEGWTRDDFREKSVVGDILRGMLIRGRLQAAVFNVFIRFCLEGVCTLSALQHPVHRNSRGQPGTCRFLKEIGSRSAWHSIGGRYQSESSSEMV
jgi:hypothetical protein